MKTLNEAKALSAGCIHLI